MFPAVCGAGRRSRAEFFAGRFSGRWLRSFRQPHPERSERRRPFPEANFRASAFPRPSGKLPARASGVLPTFGPSGSPPGRSEPPASASRAFPVPRNREAPRRQRLGVFGRRQNVLRDRISGRRHPDSPRVGLRPLGHAFRVSPGLPPELSARPSRPTFGTAPRIRVGAQIGAHSRPAPPLTRAGPSSRAS